MTQHGQQVNIILARSPFMKPSERRTYETYKDKILFLGISSFEDYPLDAHNPYSPRLNEEDYLSIYPGWLHMMHHPADHFPPHVKTILMSQSDFQLPPVNVNTLDVEKEYDFTYAATWPLGSGADPENGRCEGWSGYCKNWTFARRRSTRAAPRGVAPRGSLHEGRSTGGSQIFFILTCAHY